jgi:hypothetical protein
MPQTKVHRLLIALLFACLGYVAPAQARERLAVAMIAEGNATLSDNLVEVAIAKLAEGGDWDLVGLPELRARVSDIPTVKRDGLAKCLGESACLAEIGVLANARQLVLGRARAADGGFTFELSLVDLENAVNEARLPKVRAANVQALVLAVQSGVDELMHAHAPANEHQSAANVEPEPLAPAKAPGDEQGRLPPPVQASVAPTPQTTRQRTEPPPHVAPPPAEARGPKTWLRPVAYGATAAAVVAFAAGAIAGSIGTSPPAGNTRAERQADLERRKTYVTTANALYVTGGVCVTIAVVGFVWP